MQVEIMTGSSPGVAILGAGGLGRIRGADGSMTEMTQAGWNPLPIFFIPERLMKISVAFHQEHD
jgi:hypothetical protein